MTASRARQPITVLVDGHWTTVYPLDLVRPLPWYRRLAEAFGLGALVEAVYLIVHAERGARLAGAAAHPWRAILLNALAIPPCALHRLRVFGHELEHLRRLRDGAHPPTYAVDAHVRRAEEAACDAAGAALVRAGCALVRPAAGALDAERCVACALAGEPPCPQGPTVYARVQEALRWF